MIINPKSNVKPTFLAAIFAAIVILVISVILYCGYLYSIADPVGYCTAQKRYIPDQEFIRTAIALYEWDMNRDYKNYPNGTTSKKKNDTKYGYAIWEESRDKSECCSVFRKQSTLNRIFQQQEIEVTLVIDKKNKGDSQLPFLFDTCGKLLPHEYGFYVGEEYGFTTRNYLELTNR